MVDLGNDEILHIVDFVAKEKGINKEALLTALEEAMQTAGRKKYGNEHNIKVEINRKTGEIKIFRVLEVVENVDNYFTQISLDSVKEKKDDIALGDEILELLPPIALGRVAAQIARGVIIQKINEVERLKRFNDFKDKKGELISGIVKRLEYGNAIVDLGGNSEEAIIKSDQMLNGEYFAINDKIKAYIKDVLLESKGPQIILSRTDNNMLLRLFEVEVPEIYDGVIEVKAIARDCGSKAKVAVYASDVSIDPIGSCVGMRGARVHNITKELSGEKIDVIKWDSNTAQFIINALAPIEVLKIMIDETKQTIGIVVRNEDLNVVIGRRGQNIRLISQLVGKRLDVITDEEESNQRNETTNKIVSHYIEGLDVDEVMARLLIAEGLNSISDLAYVDIEVLNKIEGFNQEISAELQNRAQEYVDRKNTVILEQLEALGVEQDLIDMLDLNPDQILALAEYGVKSIEDLAEISVNEFKQLIPDSNFSNQDIDILIKTAKDNSDS
ncbi:MAG: transcription termination factor NusA [Rickettsiaceae bacterium]